MLIKVCGMRNIENIEQLFDTGVKMMGFIFFGRSKRFIQEDQRTHVFNSVPKEVNKVGVFVNEDIEVVKQYITQYQLNYIQLHGDESPTYCQQLKPYVKVIKAFRVNEMFDFDILIEYQNCDFLLFDAKGKEYGGNGIQYDWGLLDQYQLGVPFLLSGGIGPKDADRIRTFEHPRFAGIDVNSGFEMEPGLKNIEQISSFIKELRCNTQ